MTTGKHGRLIDKTVSLLHDMLVFCSFLWLCWSPNQPIRWITYLLVTCSALIIFRSRLAERTLVHRDPWTIGLLMFFDVIVLVAVLAMTLDHLVQLVAAAIVWISVRALLIPRTPEQDRSAGKTK